MRRALVLIAVALLMGGAHAFTLTVAFTQDVVSLDPQASNDLYSHQVNRQIYDTLIEMTEELEIAPGLAESWSQIDDLTWEFELRPGVTFHDGSPLTAADVKFTLDRLVDPANAAQARFLVSWIANVVVVDDLTVRIETAFPFAPILAHLAHTATSIMSERAVAEAGEDYGTTVAIGTGAFKFVTWEVASRVVLERNPDWWGGEVLPERVMFRPIPEASVRAIEIEAGGVDIVYILEVNDAKRLRGNANVVLDDVESLSTTYVGMNGTKAPFDNVLVRRAINHAIDVDTIVEVVLEGSGERATGPIGPSVFGYTADLPSYDYDPERARELLAEAGYPDGFDAEFWVAQQPVRITIAEIMQAQLAEIGVNIEITVMEWGAYLAATETGTQDMFILGWSTPTADADYGLHGLFHSSNIPASNRTFWSHPRVDELLDLGRRLPTPEERLPVYQEAQQLIVSEAPWVFMYTITDTNAYRPNVSGFVSHPAGHHRLWRVSKN
jgi:peptide/nickel transport system substrate-binding protein